ncbi:MAG: ABC transporter permease [Bariatricus sp.]
MYIIKNAVKSIVRAKGRNILIFILVLFVAVSACIALSVRNSAESAKEDALDALTITAQISLNREKIMGDNKMDRSAMAGAMSQSLSLEEMQMYAESEYADGFYYTESAAFNVTEDIEIYSTEMEVTSDSSNGTSNDNSNSKVNMGSNEMRSNQMSRGNLGDVTVIGYSSHDAMTTFISGENSIYEGAVFEQNSTDCTCVISYELAILNDLAVGDTIELVNPQNEAELYPFTICGIFQNVTTDSYANQIFTSYESLDSVVQKAEENAQTIVDENGFESSTALRGSVNCNYVFANVEHYEAFCTDVEKMGLDTEVYTVTSNDLSRYEQSLVPLESMSKFTMVFFWVVLLVGAGILVIFNIFCVRERKYEIGVLAAIGMKKGKVVLQFLTETFLVTCLAFLIGIGIGTAASGPVANALLEDQIESTQEANASTEKNFGGKFREGGNQNPGMAGVEYVETIDTSMDITVLFSLMGIALLLTIVASSAGMISILRYEPLRILSDRT